MKMRTGLGCVANDFDSSNSREVIGNEYQLNWVLEGMEMEQRQPIQTILSRTFALKQWFSKYGIPTRSISTIWDLKNSQSWAPSNWIKNSGSGTHHKGYKTETIKDKPLWYWLPPLPGEDYPVIFNSGVPSKTFKPSDCSHEGSNSEGQQLEKMHLFCVHACWVFSIMSDSLRLHRL